MKFFNAFLYLFFQTKKFWAYAMVFEIELN